MAMSQLALQQAPMSEINTTPLIDVMLVLLIMLILSVPVATHSLPIDLPAPPPIFNPPHIDHVRNKISITPDSRITFNGQAVTSAQMLALLGQTLKLSPEPELQFQPDPQAPYDTSAKVLSLIKRSGVSAFGMVGNEQFEAFGKAPGAPPAR